MKRAWLLGIGVCLTGCLGQEGDVDRTGAGLESTGSTAPVEVAHRTDFGSFVAPAAAATLASGAEDDLGVIANVRPTFDPKVYEARAEFRVRAGVQR